MSQFYCLNLSQHLASVLNYRLIWQAKTKIVIIRIMTNVTMFVILMTGLYRIGVGLYFISCWYIVGYEFFGVEVRV
jgi:hypothetical protein